MNIFHNRPLFCGFMSFIVLSVIGFFSSGEAKLCMMLSFLLIAVAFTVLIFKSKKLRKASIYISLISIFSLVSLLVSFLYFDTYYNSSMKVLEKEECKIKASVISEESYFVNTYIYCIEVKEIDGVQKDFKAIFESTDQALLDPGDIITVIASPEKFSDASGTYSEKLDRLSDGYFMRFESTGREKLTLEKSEDNDWLTSFILTLRTEIESKFKNYIDGDTAALSIALFLGDKHAMSDEVIRDFSRAGVSHLLALSGMHMTIIVGAFELILKRFRVSLRIRAITLSAIAVFYLALTGFSVSATRSVLMLLAVYLSHICALRADTLTTLAGVGFVMLALSPTTVADAGFWMSFGATFGILAYMEIFGDLVSLLSKIAGKKRWMSHIITYVPTTVFASICALIPMILILCIFIKEFSFMSILSTVLLSIPTTALLILCLVFTLTPGIPLLLTPIAFCIDKTAELMIKLCARISDMENIVTSLNYPHIYIFAAILGIAILISLGANFKKKRWISLIPVACAIALLFGSIGISDGINSDKVTITYLATSSNSEYVILSNDQELVLCDFSNGSNTARNEATSIMTHLHATEVNGIVITDYSSKIAVSSSRLFAEEKVRRIWLPMPTNLDDYFTMRSMVEGAEEHGVCAYVYDYGETLTVFGDVELSVLRSDISRSAVPILMLNIRSGDEQLTYLSESYAESDMQRQANAAICESDYLIFGKKGPVSKTVYSLPTGCSKLKRVLFADFTVAGFLRPETMPDGVGITVDAERLDFILYKDSKD